jgi:hypothetical protein
MIRSNFPQLMQKTVSEYTSKYQLLPPTSNSVGILSTTSPLCAPAGLTSVMGGPQPLQRIFPSEKNVYRQSKPLAKAHLGWLFDMLPTLIAPVGLGAIFARAITLGGHSPRSRHTNALAL